MTVCSKGKGLSSPCQDCWGHTPPVTATSHPLGLDTNPSQHKRQINKIYILTLSSQGAGSRGRKRNRTWSFEEESQFPEGVKNRTSQWPQQVRQSGVYLILGGWVSGPQNPDLRPVLGATESALCFLFLSVLPTQQ